MISYFTYELLRFILFFGLSAVAYFGLIYFREKKSDFPFVLLGKRKTYNYFNAIYYYTKHSMMWLLLPLFIYFTLVYFGVLSKDNFTKIIKVYDINETHVSFSKGVLLFPQTLNNGKTVKPFDQDEIIENNSSKKLLLRRNLYQKSFGVSSDSYVLLINPQTTLYCTDDNFPDYILSPAPGVIHVKGDEQKILWSLELKDQQK